MLCRRRARAAFARLHYWSHITKVHSAAAGATRARCTLVCRIKWMRQHGPFHHAAYAASYAA